MLNAVGYKEVNKMRAEDFSRLSSQGVLIFEDQKRIEIPLENGGRIVGYFPLDGVQIYAFDIRGGAVPDLTLGCLVIDAYPPQKRQERRADGE